MFQFTILQCVCLFIYLLLDFSTSVFECHVNYNIYEFCIFYEVKKLHIFRHCMGKTDCSPVVFNE